MMACEALSVAIRIHTSDDRCEEHLDHWDDQEAICGDQTRHLQHTGEDVERWRPLNSRPLLHVQSSSWSGCVLGYVEKHWVVQQLSMAISSEQDSEGRCAHFALHLPTLWRSRATTHREAGGSTMASTSCEDRQENPTLEENLWGHTALHFSECRLCLWLTLKRIGVPFLTHQHRRSFALPNQVRDQTLHRHI